MPAPRSSPSLQVISDQVAAEREARRSHAESLDTKAGVVLGFAGVLVGLARPDLPAGRNKTFAPVLAVR